MWGTSKFIVAIYSLVRSVTRWHHPGKFMESRLYSPVLTTRLSATIDQLPASSSEYYPEGLRGSANAFVVFVGPSYGAYNGTGERYLGGPHRPQSSWSRRCIGAGLGLDPFPDGSRSRQERWNRLLLACLATPDGVRYLSALYNLDWGHFPSERSVPTENLTLGADVVVEYLNRAKPRIVVPLTKLVWSHLLPALIRFETTILKDGPIAHHQSMLVRLKYNKIPLEHDTIIVRPHNHPSRHFLTTKWIETLGMELARFIDI